MNTDLLHAQALMRTEGLSFPQLPSELAERLRERSKDIFSTDERITSAYALETHVARFLESAAPSDYAVLAMDGHGFNSWAFHYFLVSGPLALFVQLPWGGAYADTEASRADIERVLAWANPLPERLAQLQKQGRLPTGKKLLAVLTRFSKPRWAWIPPGESTPRDIDWQPADNMLSRINAELDTLSGQAATA